MISLFWHQGFVLFFRLLLVRVYVPPGRQWGESGGLLQLLRWCGTCWVSAAGLVWPYQVDFCHLLLITVSGPWPFCSNPRPSPISLILVRLLCIHQSPPYTCHPISLAFAETPGSFFLKHGLHFIYLVTSPPTSVLLSYPGSRGKRKLFLLGLQVTGAPHKLYNILREFMLGNYILLWLSW